VRLFDEEGQLIPMRAEAAEAEAARLQRELEQLKGNKH